MHLLHLLMGRNQFLLNFSVHCETGFNVEVSDLECAAGILLQSPYHSHHKIYIQNVYQCIPHVWGISVILLYSE